MKTQLQVYARLKPSEQNPLSYQIDRSRKTLIIGQKQNKVGFINNFKDTIEFNFADILDINATQDQVFQLVAVPVLLNCLDGYNGTVFAYGQTGSGKTYTINGSDSWAYRGIIPRVMTHVFEVIDQRRDEFDYKVYVSYMEIYNEKAYDLLNEDHLVSPIEQWNKIQFKRDNQGNIHLSNISLHEIDDAKPGIDLLMMGNFIRKQAATPMNQCSSRSHCIFTITFEARQIETGDCFVSKLNLVDLAGSERVSKTNHDGVLLSEAKSINLSLSYLEQVIVALNEKKRTGQREHIPYRHSILTTILKDSLGGNCKTVMIANVSTELDNFEETISALRFSQRVGQLENEIHRNQKVDLSAQVEKLELEKQVLLDELEKYQRLVGEFKGARGPPPMIIAGSTSSSRISLAQSSAPTYNEQDEADELEALINKVDEYMTEKTDMLEVRDMVEARLCFRAMKEFHKSTMAEYLQELSDISKKLKQYDALIPQEHQPPVAGEKKRIAGGVNNGVNGDSEITEMALNRFYPKANEELELQQMAVQQQHAFQQTFAAQQQQQGQQQRQGGEQASYTSSSRSITRGFEYKPVYYHPDSQINNQQQQQHQQLQQQQQHLKKQLQQQQQQQQLQQQQQQLEQQLQQQQQQQQFGEDERDENNTKRNRKPKATKKRVPQHDNTQADEQYITQSRQQQTRQHKDSNDISADGIEINIYKQESNRAGGGDVGGGSRTPKQQLQHIMPPQVGPSKNNNYVYTNL